MPMAVLLIPTASQCFSAAWPLVLFALAVWFWRNGEAAIARLFPEWEWQRALGWLDLKADRNAARILAGLTHLLHLVLLAALGGILFLSWTFGQPHESADGLVVLTLLLEWVYMFVCYGVWIYYLGFMLYPRIRDEFEAEELVRYRIENPDVENERKSKDHLNVSIWESGRPRRF